MPTVASVGTYRVYARWNSAATRPSEVLYRVTHADGVTENREWSQTGWGSAWNYLGTYDFAPSSGHKVELFADYVGTVMADAVMLVPEASTGIARATWTREIEVPGRYEVGGWWREASTRTWMAPFTVTHPGGSETKRFNQRATLTDWRLLGTYTFQPGEPAEVVLENAINDPSDYVIADAIRWRWAGDPGIAAWAFTVAQAGSHDVYARWVAAPGNAPDAKYAVHHDGGATVVAVDQRHQSGEWVKLGSFAFEAGGYKVELSDQASGLVTADAVYVVPTPAGDPDSYTWTPTIATTADYQLYARWTAGPDRAANAEYVVETPGGLDLVTVSQRQGGGAWNLLGTFALEAGTGNRIVLNAAAADGTLVADAIRIVRAVAAGEIAYVHTDHLGQPQKLTDATAALLWDRVALPFGATHSEAGLGETSLRFPGQWADAESGLHYNYFRDYDPSLGRYIESDPIGLAGGLNTYAYVGGNPVNKIDKYGLQVAPPMPGPLPLPLPPIAIPGTPENRAWTEWATGQIQDLVDYLAKLCRELGEDECYQKCKHLLPSPSGDLQSSEFRKCYRECKGTL